MWKMDDDEDMRIEVDRTRDTSCSVTSIQVLHTFSQFGCMGVQCNSHPHPHAPTRPASVKIRVIALDKS